MEFSKVNTSDPDTKEALKKAEACLEEGTGSLATRQKHSCIADRSPFGWGTVKHYQSDPLADGPEDEKDISWSEKDTRKEVEKHRLLNINGKAVGKGAKSCHMESTTVGKSPSKQCGPSGLPWCPCGKTGHE